MYLSVLKFFNSEKSIDHPIMGHLSCSSLQQGYTQCMDYVQGGNDQVRQCQGVYNLSILCFKAESSAEFKKILDDRIQERVKLLKYLRENESKLPELQKKNMQQAFNMLTEIEAADIINEDEVASYYNKQKASNKDFL